jgi:hypothetical protein
MVIYGNLVKVRTHTLSNGDNDRGEGEEKK